MLKRIAQTLWGNFESWEEIQKFGLLGLIFGLIIGVYWALRPLKDSIFGSTVGIDWQPFAKGLSLVIIIPLIMGYSKLIDTFPRQRVFYILTILYGIAALIFSWFFLDPHYGIANTVHSPWRIIGWLWYVYVESFGSLIVALFWAFTVDITTEASARRGFPFISLLGQTGNILGPLLLNAKLWGFVNSAPIIAILGILIFGTTFLMWFFLKVTPKNQLQGYQARDEKEKEKEPGFFEGLKLLGSQPYLLGIFLIITIYEIIVTVFDFHFKAMTMAAFPLQVDSAAYLSKYAVYTGVVATLCVFFGISNIQRRLGITASLIIMPLLVAGGVVLLKLSPKLAVAFWIMVIAKAVNYALNQPTMKQLYIPTTREARYKSQAWIEMFGSRGSKAAGSIINGFRGTFIKNYGYLTGVSLFLTMSSTISLGLIGIWFFVVLYVARTYNKAIGEKTVVC